MRQPLSAPRAGGQLASPAAFAAGRRLRGVSGRTARFARAPVGCTVRTVPPRGGRAGGSSSGEGGMFLFQGRAEAEVRKLRAEHPGAMRPGYCFDGRACPIRWGWRRAAGNAAGELRHGDAALEACLLHPRGYEVDVLHGRSAVANAPIPIPKKTHSLTNSSTRMARSPLRTRQRRLRSTPTRRASSATLMPR